MNTQMTNKVSPREKYSYAIASGGGNIITQILGTFLTSYLTDSVGIAAAAVGTMMLIARFFDGASDIVMGGIIDRTNTKLGKARPWLLVSAPLVCVALIITFSVPASLSAAAKLVYAYLSYIFLNCICMTIFFVSHTSLLARISLDGHERQKMASLNQILNQVGGLAVTTFMVALVAKFGWQGTAVIYGLITAVCILIGFWGTREHVAASQSDGEPKAETVPLKVAVPALMKNKYFFLLTGLFILMLAQAAGPGSMTYYYCNSVLNNLGMVSFISACGIVPVILINFFVPSITKRFGSRNCLVASAAANALGFLLVGLFNTNVVIVSIGFIIKGFAGGVLFACGFAMSAQVVDYGEWKTGVRSEGLINASVSFGQKVGLGFGPAIASWIIGAGGYDGTAAVQSASAVSAINFAFSYFGVILSVLALIIALFLNLDKYSDQIRADLEEKHKTV